MLDFRVRLIRNPWSHTVPGETLMAILTKVAQSRAKHVEKMHEVGEWKRDSLGLAILDPTAPISLPSSEALLATISIGPEGDRFVVNAVAKAVEHRDKGQLAGYGVYTDLTQTADGDFTYGFSTQVDNTIGGASGQSELQDACEAGHALVSFNYWIRDVRNGWREAYPGNRWFSHVDEPDETYTAMAEDDVIAVNSSDIESRRDIVSAPEGER
jgi:hypothetical protein